MNNPYPANTISAALQDQVEEQMRRDQIQAQRRWFRWGMLTIFLTILLAGVVIPAARAPMEAQGLAILALTFGHFSLDVWTVIQRIYSLAQLPRHIRCGNAYPT